MSDNLRFWKAVSNVPAHAQKKIGGGRLKGMTDISPQWRYQVITEIFGPVGVGWNFRIDQQWVEERESLVCAFTNVSVKVKIDGEWSEWVPGTGGSMLVAKESAGPYVSDECFKMSLTDALSVALKMFGVAADIYLGGSGRTDSKYASSPPPAKTDTAEEKKLKDSAIATILKHGKWFNDNDKKADFLRLFEVQFGVKPKKDIVGHLGTFSYEHLRGFDKVLVRTIRSHEDKMDEALPF